MPLPVPGKNTQKLKGNGQKIVGIEECVTFVQRESRRRGGLSGSGSGSGSGTTFAPIRGRLNSRFERLTNSCPRLCRGYLTGEAHPTLILSLDSSLLTRLGRNADLRVRAVVLGGEDPQGQSSRRALAGAGAA